MRSLPKYLLLLSVVIAPLSALAADPAPKAKTPQQERMTACNQKATGMKGDERKNFMSSCLKGEMDTAKLTPQERMKVCNKEAGEKALKGDERKSFMSSCLKGAA